MPLFMCRKCGCVENTACCNYWSSRTDEKPILCSECDPNIGEWHNQFPKRPAAGMLVDQQGHLWGAESRIPVNFTILGSVATEGADGMGGADE